MSGQVLHVGTVLLCAHGGSAKPIAPFPRVLLSGQPAVTTAGPWAITGCNLAVLPATPCVTGHFTTGADRVLAGGSPLALFTGTSSCIPTGTPMTPVSAQTRVVAEG
ncbi:MAG: hypothetical protein H0U15_09115 [Geodermatophilaceae bacterium]|jgi:hypothetical protein|nr:hypothetical protein [Geodermatophilaceae bacterium]